MDTYLSYIKSSWKSLIPCNKLSVESIDELSSEYDLEKMFLYAFYGYNDSLNKYSFDQLKRCINSKDDNICYVAIARGNMKLLEYLIDRGFDLHKTYDHKNNLCYRVAVIYNQIEMMKYLENNNLATDKAECINLASRYMSLDAYRYLSDNSAEKDKNDKIIEDIINTNNEIKEIEKKIEESQKQYNESWNSYIFSNTDVIEYNKKIDELKSKVYEYTKELTH